MAAPDEATSPANSHINSYKEIPIRLVEDPVAAWGSEIDCILVRHFQIRDSRFTGESLYDADDIGVLQMEISI